MSRLKRGLVILLCVCMAGGMLLLHASAKGTKSENALQTESAGNNQGEVKEYAVNTADTEGTDASHYNADGFCSGYELTADGTWAKKSGEAACTEEGCSGYQPAALTTDQYDIDGDGNKDAVYEIGNAGQLYWFAGLVNGDAGVCTGGVTRNLSANAVLTADITVNENVLKSDGTLSENTDGFRSWTPIGFFSDDAGGNYYSGKYDGQSHTISGLYFDVWRTGYAGLFSGIESNAVISNVGVVDSYFGGMSAGGVCTANKGTIINCYNTGAVSGGSRFGGGVCAVNEGKIINCYNTGIVSDNARIAGGVCGSDGGTIANCYFDSTIYGGYAVGGGTDADTAVEGKTTAQFASGEVAWLLSQGCTTGEDEAAVTYDGSVWGQKLGGEAADAAPVLKKAGDEGNTVYQNAEYPGCEKKPGDAVYVYTNEATAPAYKEHIYSNSGFCQFCGGAYQPADLTTDKYDINGDGSKDAVYEIGNAGQLYWFAGLVNGDTGVCIGEVTRNLSANAVLTADITVNENVLKEDGTLSDDTSGFRSWTPIGNSSAYRGCFDGQSHAISGLYFSNSDADYVGLFHTAEADAVISNVGIRDSYFYGRNYVSAMCGRNRGTVTDCYNAGSVKGRVQHVSGVCGINYGTISSSYNTGTVTAGGGFGAGGVCGWNKGGTIRSSYNTGEVTASGRAGGVCGLNSGTVTGSIPTITGSYNTGEVTVTGSDGKAGGVCGENDGAITNSYNTGEVIADGSGCKAGGVCGYNEKGTLSNSYSAGKITAAASDGVAGGVCGTSEKTISNCYFDSTIYSGEAVGGGSGTAAATEGRTTDQFASGEAAWLLSQGCTIGEGDAAVTYDGSDWGQKLGEEATDTYPVLDSTKKVYKGYNGTCRAIYSNHQMDQTPVHSFGTDGFCQFCGEVYQPAVLTTDQYAVPDGMSEDEKNYHDKNKDGKMDAVYEIGNAGQLYWFAGLVNDKESVCTDGVAKNYWANAVLTADITVNENVLKEDGNLSDDASGFRSWTPIGRDSSNYYMGIFDGRSHTISGLYFDDQEYISGSNVGLFGWNKGSISNVGIVDSYFSGNMYVGGVCGQSQESISNCYHTGVVSGNRYVGGVCGDNGRTITNCYHAGIVNGNSSVGGVCGRNDGTTANCYFDSTVYSGAAIGVNNGTAAAAEGRTTAWFAGGEAAWLLSQGCTIKAATYDGSVWGQKLGEGGDTYPVLDSAKKVYMGYGESCKPPVYSNDESIVKPAPHRFGDDGFCTVCGAYQPAKLTTDQYDIDGNGSKDEVYEIGNAGQLYWFAGLVNGDAGVCTEGVTRNLSANAVLVADITVNGNVLKPDGTLSDSVDSFRSWTPINNNPDTAYRGCFDGQSHTINGLYFSNPEADYVGLFGAAGAAAISNVGIVDSYFKANSRVGGVCGYSRGEITGCHNAGSVIGRDNVGGVCGYNSKGEITGCYNTGMVTYENDTTGSDVGGVCGNNYGTIKGSYNTGKVTASSTGVYAGGVCGFNAGTLSGSYNTGEVTADGSGVITGGVCGYNYGTLSGSYNTGEVTAGGSRVYAGGVCGYNYGTLSSSYSTGKITANASDGVAGGVCGTNDNTISNCCFDSTVYSGDAVGSGSGTAAATEGMTTAQFKSGEVAYLLNEGRTDGSQAWYQNIDNDGSKDGIPVLDSTHGTVYASTPCPIEFSNAADKAVEHAFALDPEDETQHICTACGHTEKHADVAVFTADPEAHSISASCSSCGNLGRVTLSAAGAVYDGTDKAASVSGTIKGITIPDIVYEKKNGEAYTEITGAPKDAGTYRAGITLGTGANAGAVTVEYTIQPAAPVITWNTPASVFYTGKAVTSEKLTTPAVTLVNGETFSGQIAYSYREHGSDAAFTEGLPAENGTYDVKAGIAADGNYTEAETTITLTIQWLETTQKAALTDKDNRPLSGDSWWAPGVTFTAPDGFTISDSLTGVYGASFIYDTETSAAGTDVTYYLKNSDGETAVKTEAVRIDRTAPDWTGNNCGINIKENWWKAMLNDISHGLHYKETADVNVCAADSISGVTAYYYYIDSAGGTVKTAEELDELVFTEHTAGVPGSKDAVTVAGLNPDGSYIVYAYAVDAAGNRSAYVCSDGVVVDDTAPVISGMSVPDKEASTLTDTGARISFTGSEAGTYFYVCAEKNSSMPAPASIADFAAEQTHDGYSTWTAKDGVSFASMTPGAGNEITLSGLKADTAYTLYLAAADLAGNSTGTTVVTREFTTCKTVPVITVQPAISGTYGQTAGEMTLTAGKAEAYNEDIAGTWRVTDTKASDMPAVGTGNSYTVTFEPEAGRYETVSVQVTPVVAPRPVAITVENKTKTYGETNPEFTFTVPEGALAGSDAAEALGVTLSCEAKTDSHVREGGYAITGTSANANYEVTVIPGTLTIIKADAQLTVSTVNYDKIFGDAAFRPDVTAGNTEADVQYDITSGNDVVSVSDGAVTILKAGTATVTVSLPASTNYNAAAPVTITVNVAKKGGYTTAGMNKRYFHARDNEDTIDLSGLLPADCGNVTYGTPQITADLYTDRGKPEVSGDGRLSYTVKQAAGAGAAGTITVPVTTDNYETFAITVNVEQIDKLPVSLQDGSSVTLENSTLTYGEKLSKLAFNRAVFADGDGNEVTGTLAWKTPAAMPDAGTTSAAWMFTPDDEAYAAMEGTVAITVYKATPYIAENPAASAVTYGQTLADSSLTGGRAACRDADGVQITGLFAWKNGSIKPSAADNGVTEYEVTFIPSDTANYNTVEMKLTLTVNKAAQAPDMPGSEMRPAHSTAKVGDITLPAGWSWSDADKDKELPDDVKVTAMAVYTGADKGNYETESISVTITRSTCEHRNTEIRNRKEPACEAEGYTGDTYCTDCGSLLAAGKKTAAPGHDYQSAVTKQPSTTEEGIMTYTCKTCGSSFTQPIARIADDDGGRDNGNKNQNPEPDAGSGMDAGAGKTGQGQNGSGKDTGAGKTGQGQNSSGKDTGAGKTGHGQNGSGTDSGTVNGQDNPEQREADTEIKPYIKDDSGKKGWEAIRPQLDGAKSGETVTVAMNGTTVVPKNVIDSIRGRDVTLVLDMGNGISWNINGKDITGASGDTDFGITTGADAGKTIPADVINNVTGERYSMNLTLSYSGGFGFTAILTVNMESRNAGMYANLFYYNEQTGELEFVTAGQIDKDGNVKLAFTHASDYIIVIDAAVMDGGSDGSITSASDAEDGTDTVSGKDDTKEQNTWNPAVVIIIGTGIILIVCGAVIYVRKKNGSDET